MSNSNQNQIPRIAILMAAYNGTSWLKEQIDSILRQEDVEVNLYISVDQSTDGTEDLINLLAIDENRIQVMSHGIRFGGAAPNFYRLIQEVDFSTYDYVAFSDQDDVWNADKLKMAISTILVKNIDGYSSNVTAFWSNGRKKFINKAQKQTQWDFLFEAAGPGCTYVLTQKLATHMQGFVRQHFPEIQQISLHDWLVYAYARANHFRWYIDPRSSLLYRQHSNNQVGANIGLLALIKRSHKVQNGWWLSQSLFIAKAIGLEKNAFVLKWSVGTRMGYLRLGKSFLICRRRRKDQFLFLFACLALCFMKTIISSKASPKDLT